MCLTLLYGLKEVVLEVDDECVDDSPGYGESNDVLSCSLQHPSDELHQFKVE